MKLDSIKPQKYTIYVDLDGVLADLHSYIEDLIGVELKTQANGNWVNDVEIWDKVHKMDGEPKFDKLKLLPDAMELWNHVKPHSPNILTATGTPVDENAKKKVNWVKKNLTGYKNIHTVEASAHKADFATPTSILIDDRTKSIDPWKKAGGIGILHTSAKDTIAQLKKLGL